jgi:hypothetical protein
MISPSSAVKPIVVSTLAPAHRAKARPVAQMGDDHPPLRQRRIERGQTGRDIFVGQSVEAIAAHPPRGIGARERQARGDAGHGMVEAGVETGDLHQMRGLACDLADRGEVVGLVERGERGKGIKFGNERLVDQARCPIAPAAMDHAVTDRDDGVILKVIVGPVVEFAEQGLVGQPGAAVLGSLAPAFSSRTSPVSLWMRMRGAVPIPSSLPPATWTGPCSSR